MSIQSIRGVRDVLPVEGRRWRAVEEALRGCLLGSGYEEIHLPLLEFTELFSRGVGEATDIVEKEMYTLADRDGESITLRPEGTAGCVRALQQHGLLYNQTQRVFYAGEMFRYERPQKGRYRQFYQLGAEAFGFAGPDIDAELIYLGWQFWRALGLEQHAQLELNNLGSAAARVAYRKALVDFLQPRAEQLDADSQRRLTTNPLRILDSKDPATQEVLHNAPFPGHREQKQWAVDHAAHEWVLCLDADERVKIAHELGIPLSDDAARRAEFYKPADDSPEMQYLRERREELGGYVPERTRTSVMLGSPSDDVFEEFKHGTEGREAEHAGEGGELRGQGGVLAGGSWSARARDATTTNVPTPEMPVQSRARA